MAQTQNIGISQLPNGNWCYRFTRTVDGKRINRKSSKDEAGNPLKTKKAIAEMRFEASLYQKPEHRMTSGEVYMEYCEQRRAYQYVEGFLKMFYLIFGQSYSRNYLKYHEIRCNLKIFEGNELF